MIKFLFVFFSFLFLIYMVLPGPTKVEQFSGLPNSFKSNEPGDTVQNPNIAAYYSNYYRIFVIPFYHQEFSKQFNYLGFNLPYVVLNHPPEKAREVVKPYIETWYLEEFIHPLRESLYVSGWEPYDEMDRRRTNYAYRINIQGVSYKSKTNLRYYPSPLWARILVWAGVTFSFVLIYNLTKKILKEKYV